MIIPDPRTVGEGVNVWAGELAIGSVSSDSERVVEGADALRWTLADHRTQRASHGLLKEFVRLHKHPVEKILAFATKWGPLMLCRHNLPVTHSPDCHVELLDTGWTNSDGVPTYWESIDGWYTLSRQAWAIFNIVADLAQERPGTPEDWNDIWQGFSEPFDPGLGLMPSTYMTAGAIASMSTKDQKKEIGLAVSAWLLWSGIRPTVVWSPDQHATAAYNMGPFSGLYAHLALQLADAVTSPPGIFSCSMCGEPYRPTSGRQPGRDKRHYCSTCSPLARAAAQNRYWNSKGTITRRKRREKQKMIGGKGAVANE